MVCQWGDPLSDKQCLRQPVTNSLMFYLSIKRRIVRFWVGKHGTCRFSLQGNLVSKFV
jgi:hypothetical protein